MQEYSSAGNTFSMSRWAMTLPMVARRSPAMTTPPSNVAATMVVPCGATSARSPMPRAEAPGTRPGACWARKSAKDEEPAAV
jgi:hypothetical protein